MFVLMNTTENNNCCFGSIKQKNQLSKQILEPDWLECNLNTTIYQMCRFELI